LALPAQEAACQEAARKRRRQKELADGPAEPSGGAAGGRPSRIEAMAMALVAVPCACMWPVALALELIRDLRLMFII
jgi:hypothetical protein